MKKVTFFFILSFLLSNAIYAQYSVSGTVFDEDGQPLPGASIFLKDNNLHGTVSAQNGKYTLNLASVDNTTICVSFMGYLTQEIKIKPSQSRNLNFYLEPDHELINEVVVTATRTPKLLKDVPIVTRVIAMDQIKHLDATHIVDLLQTELPGIEFTYSMNQQVALNMQGFGGNAVLFLVDGERVAGETLENIDYNRLNLDNVERIEIVKGAASSLYGSNAVGGVVNLISKNQCKPWSMNINSRWGAHNEQRYGASLGFNAGKINNQLNVQHAQVGAIKLKREGDFAQIYANKNWNFKDRLTYTPINNLKVTAKAGYFFRERASQQMVNERYRGFNGGLKGNYKIGSVADVELSYIFDQYDKSDFALASRRDVRDYSNVQHCLRGLFNQHFGSNILTLGSDFMRDYQQSYQFANGGSHTQFSGAAYAQFDWNITTQLNVTSGVRYDYYSAAHKHNVSPKLGLMYKIGHHSLRASYAAGFRAPTLKEMYMSFNMANVFMIYGNPDLQSEKSHNFALSAEYLKNGYNITITGFHNIVDQRITTAWHEGMGGQKYVNMPSMTINGIDANLGARWAFGLAAKLSYAYTHEHLAKGNPRTSLTRPHTATLRVEYAKKWKNYGFSIGLNGRVLSAVTTQVLKSDKNDEESSLRTYPAYSLWSINLTQRLWKGFNLSVAVNNLFNYIPDYYYNNSPKTTGTTFSAGLSIDLDAPF